MIGTMGSVPPPLKSRQLNTPAFPATLVARPLEDALATGVRILGISGV